MDTMKVILIPPTDPPLSKKVTTKKPPVKRIITETQSWKTLSDDSLLAINQQTHVDNPSPLVLQQIGTKLAGYRAQDQEKGILDLTKLITMEQILELLRASELHCYYCKEGVLVLYEFARDPKQWTLERIDNLIGHNDGNVVISCLTCNLRRRTMRPERYLLTKQIACIRKIDGQDPKDPCQDPKDPCQDPKDPCQDPKDPCQDPKDPCQDPKDPGDPDTNKNDMKR
jgi:hypothetical protein